MTGPIVRIPQGHFNALDNSLGGPEEVVFLYASYAHGMFDVDGVEVMMSADIASQSKLHVELKDDVRPRIIKTAWDTNRCLIEVHSHGDRGYPEFSPSDLHGFEEWVPHVRWRLRNRPYGALVKAGEAWDGLAWIDNEPCTIAAIEVTNGGALIQTVIPTNATAAKLVAKGRRD